MHRMDLLQMKLNIFIVCTSLIHHWIIFAFAGGGGVLLTLTVNYSLMYIFWIFL